MFLTDIDKHELKKRIDEAAGASFSGWDFSYINRFGGKPEFPCPWDYEKNVRDRMRNAGSLLDLGTGGGEFLAFLHPFPCRVTATEAYEPNVEVAGKKLEPLGVQVVATKEGMQEAAPLPFTDLAFDLVINRHESYESREIYRILKPGGRFITQQVGCRDLERLVTIFGSLSSEEEFEWDLENAVKFLTEAGFSVLERKEHIAAARFYDIRTVVYFLKVLAWLFPDFDTDSYRKRLENIHLLIKRDGFFEDTCHRFFIVAEK